MSKIFKFKTLTDSTDWKPTLIVYGDLGVSYGETIPYLIQEAENGTVDVVFHNGDFAYDLGTVCYFVKITFWQKNFNL